MKSLEQNSDISVVAHWLLMLLASYIRQNNLTGTARCPVVHYAASGFSAFLASYSLSFCLYSSSVSLCQPTHLPVGERPHPQLISNDPCNSFKLIDELVTQLRKFKSFINFVFDGPGSQKHSCTTRQAIPNEILWTLVDGFIKKELIPSRC